MTGKDLVEHIHPSRRDYAKEDAINWWSNRPRYERRMARTLLLSHDDYVRMNRLHPACAICSKPVDKFHWQFDGIKCILIAECHGETEIMYVGLDDITDLLQNGVSGGEAFATKRIEGNYAT